MCFTNQHQRVVPVYPKRLSVGALNHEDTTQKLLESYKYINFIKQAELFLVLLSETKLWPTRSEGVVSRKECYSDVVNGCVVTSADSAISYRSADQTPS